jgi:hypothetical protein
MLNLASSQVPVERQITYLVARIRFEDTVDRLDVSN